MNKSKITFEKNSEEQTSFVSENSSDNIKKTHPEETIIELSEKKIKKSKKKPVKESSVSEKKSIKEETIIELSEEPEKPISKPRTRKILHDSIQGITKPAIERVCQRAGVKRKSGYIYAELRNIMKNYMTELIRNIIIFTEHARRKTVQRGDLEAALQISGMYLGAGINQDLDKNFSTVKARQRGGKGNSDGIKKVHRFKPGTVALQEIRYQQKHSDELAFPKLNFQRLTREIAQDFGEEFRFAGDLLELLQVTVENYLIQIVRNANLICLHADRQTIMPKDIQLVITILDTSV